MSPSRRSVARHCRSRSTKTSRPTNPPTSVPSGKPSSHPTSRPSYSLQTDWVKILLALQSNLTKTSFIQEFYDELVVTEQLYEYGGCDVWSTFLSEKLYYQTFAAKIESIYFAVQSEIAAQYQAPTELGI